MARKPRDFDAELTALMAKAKKVKGQKTVQLGELVQVAGADGLPIEALAGALLAVVEQAEKQPEAVTRWTERGQAFFRKVAGEGRRLAPATLLSELQATTAQLGRLCVWHHRLQVDRNLGDGRKWMRDRRERTRQLIELGGLVQKAGLVELTADHRATLLGAFLELAEQLQSSYGEGHRRRWRQRGFDAFAADDPTNDEAGQPEERQL